MTKLESQKRKRKKVCGENYFHDYETISKSYISSEKIPTPILGIFIDKAGRLHFNDSVFSDKILLSKKVCLECGKCVDEVQILDECVKEYKQRKQLAKKIWEDCKG